MPRRYVFALYISTLYSYSILSIVLRIPADNHYSLEGAKTAFNSCKVLGRSMIFKMELCLFIYFEAVCRLHKSWNPVNNFKW